MWNSNMSVGSGGGGGGSDLFSTREISLLIELVEALPILYAADKKSFKSIISRDKAWKIIADKLNKPVTDCEKKWRYLRDKYVKERRRLQDESKTSPNGDTKSNWLHYESMEFLAKHLRLPCNSTAYNGTGRNSSGGVSGAEDEDSLRFSDGSPGQTCPPQTPPMNSENTDQSSKSANNLPKLPAIASNWQSLLDQDQLTRLHNTMAGYQMMQRSAAMVPGLGTAHPLWALWNNTLQQQQQQQQQQGGQSMTSGGIQSPRPPDRQSSHNGGTADNRQPMSEGSTHGHIHHHARKVKREDMNGGEPLAKRRYTSQHSANTQQDISVHVSLSDLQPSDRYAEYHFCVSLAQMLEQIPSQDRAELKIKLMQLIMDSSAKNNNHLNVSHCRAAAAASTEVQHSSSLTAASGTARGKSAMSAASTNSLTVSDNNNSVTTAEATV